MSLQDNELARRENGRTELREAAARVRWMIENLATSDGHRLNVIFTCSVRALSRPTELRMLEEVFLDQRLAVTTADVIAHFATAFRSAAERCALNFSADDWLQDQTRQAMVDALREAGQRVAFACGLEILPPFHVDLESPSFQRQKIESMQRQLAERRAAGQVELFQRAAELLRQFESIRQNSPQLSPGAVLEQLSPADRGMMLETLLLASAKDQRSTLWAVAGPYLVRIDVRSSPVNTQLTSLPTTLGPLRSVQVAEVSGRKVLLVGARSGVIVMDPDSLESAEAYADPEITSAQGFSRAVAWNDEIWACHSDGGTVGWKIGQTASPHFTHRAQARNLNVLDENRLIFSSADRLMTLDRNREIRLAGSNRGAEIAAVLPSASDMIVVQADGQISRLDRATLETLSTEHRSEAISAAALLPWLGSARLLLAGENGPIECVGLDDALVTQYQSPHRGLRILAATSDLIAGVSADRQRVILWNPWTTRNPVAELYLYATTKHRIADVEFS